MKSYRQSSYLFIINLALCLCAGTTWAEDQYVECELINPSDLKNLSSPLFGLSDSFKKNPKSIIAWAYYAEDNTVITSFGIDKTMDKSDPLSSYYRKRLEEHADWLKQGTLSKMPDYSPKVKFPYYREHQCSLIHSSKYKTLVDTWRIHRKPWLPSETPPDWELEIIPDPKAGGKKEHGDIPLKCTSFEVGKGDSPIPANFTAMYRPLIDKLTNVTASDLPEICKEK